MAGRGRGAAGDPLPSTSAEAEAEAAAAPSWGDVPDNILVRICAFLPCRADRVHMACVNRAWIAAVLGLRRPPPPALPALPPLPPQLPWLIFPSTAAPTFYSAIAARFHRLRGLPDFVRRARFCGSGDGGWFVLALDAQHNYALYNLNSGRGILLPPSFTDHAGRNLPLVVRVATFSAAPSPSYRYVVAAIVLAAGRSTAAFWSEGSEHWFTAGRALADRPQDVIYHGDAFFFVTSSEGVVSFRPGYGYLARVDYDMEPREDYHTDVGLVQGTGEMRRYLVESRGRLLMVVRYVYGEGEGTGMLRVFGFRVLDPAANVLQQRPRATWEHLGDDERDELDGRMLFLGAGCSRSFEVASYSGFEESTIYFLDDNFVSETSADGATLYSFTDMGRYSTEGMSFQDWPQDHPTTSDIAPPTWWLP